MNGVALLIAEGGFWNSVAFGIIGMVVVGSSWCLIGLVMGSAPKRGIDSGIVQLLGGVLSVVISLTIIVAGKGFPDCSAKVFYLTCGSLALGGFLNFFMLQVMSKAMQLGPNGIIWAIIQSALIFPFLGGVAFFGMEVTAVRVCGMICILLALAGFGLSKDNSGSKGNLWKLLAFFALGIAGVQQNLTTAPSYFPEARVIDSILRTLSTAIGALAAGIIYFIATCSKEHFEQLKRNVKTPMLWGYVLALQFFGLIFAYTLQYPGMNALADHGMGGLCYPLMVGSCIGSFTLTSILWLKEKIRPMQYASLALCVAGLVLICL